MYNNTEEIILTAHQVEYRQNGVRHCETGPAVIIFNGRKFWYIQGSQIEESEFNKRLTFLHNKVQ